MQVQLYRHTFLGSTLLTLAVKAPCEQQGQAFPTNRPRSGVIGLTQEATSTLAAILALDTFSIFFIPHFIHAFMLFRKALEQMRWPLFYLKQKQYTNFSNYGSVTVLKHLVLAF